MVKIIEPFSTGGTIALILGIYVFSLAVSIFYIFYHVSRDKASWRLFVLSVAYSSLFVFLNIIAIFDLFWNNREEFYKIFDFMT